MTSSNTASHATTTSMNGHHHHQHHSAASNSSNKNVGILAMEVYTPRTYIKQQALEQHMGVASGKYTIGLGQDALAITGDAEDINSICLTVLHSLLEKYDIDPCMIGRLEVGTETMIDKSKSTKTVLMDLFRDSGNTDVEGATIVNACYGGTAALLNAMLWCESNDNCCDIADYDSNDDRRPFAVVIAADIASYARGPARPTCGVGAVAILVGRNAPLTFCAREKTTHASNVWDFFKPDHTTEYPMVNGQLSQVCYYQALEDTYTRFCQKMEKSIQRISKETTMQQPLFDATSADYFVFHSPYNKLVQKSYARLFLLDARRQHERQQQQQQTAETKASVLVDATEATVAAEVEEKKESSSIDNNENNNPLQEWLEKPIQETYNDKVLEKLLQNLSKQSYQQRLIDANAASQVVGNTYTASVFLGLASLIDKQGRNDNDGGLTPGKSIVVFSYGSGALATMYRLQIREPTGASRFTIANMAHTMQLTERLASREEVHASELDHALETRARMHRAGAPYSPVYPTIGRLFPGTYYLNGIDAEWKRTYSRVPLDAEVQVPSSVMIPLAPPIVLRLAQQDAFSHPVTGKLQVMASAKEGNADQHTEARRRIACVITGTAAGLPGGARVFGPDNMDRLIRGEQCIKPISECGKTAMLEKNVVQIKKSLKDGKLMTERVAVDNEDSVIKLAAQLGSFCLSTSYGVPPGLAQTMDVAAQVAVAAGMEALKDAGLVSGKSNDPSEWQLPECYRDSTGVVYASSFPAMDAAVGEVMCFLKCQTVSAAASLSLIDALRGRFMKTLAANGGTLSEEDESAFDRLVALAKGDEHNSNGTTSNGFPTNGNRNHAAYEFDRKFLFRVLVLGNAQLAQLAGCRGPNTQTNAACAGTTQAIAMAQDMLISGRAQRVVVVAGDNASGDVLLPWLGSGFRALGAATTKAAVEDAALPFDRRRSGLLLGAGGIGMVLETEMSMLDRQNSPSSLPFQVKARLLATQYSNSAFHGAALDRKHIGSELKRFLTDIELVHGICKAEIATHGVYFSHETCTHASDASSCSGNEIAALRFALGDELLSKLVIVNTKGFTGHPMGVSFEDVTAVEVLLQQKIPPMPNYKEKDDYLGNLKISKGGPYACRYALRFAAGFGSQVAFALYATEQEV